MLNYFKIVLVSSPEPFSPVSGGGGGGIFFFFPFFLPAPPPGLMPFPPVCYVLCNSSASINLTLEGIRALAWFAAPALRGKKEKTASCRSTAVTSGSSWQHRPSLVILFETLSGKGTCFIINSERRSPPSPRLVFLWRWSKGWGGGNTAEGAQERKFWRDLICRFAGVDALLGALFEGLNKKCVL